jgi:cobalamin biosynthesis Mg chelatase CobN
MQVRTRTYEPAKFGGKELEGPIEEQQPCPFEPCHDLGGIFSSLFGSSEPSKPSEPSKTNTEPAKTNTEPSKPLEPSKTETDQSKTETDQSETESFDSAYMILLIIVFIVLAFVIGILVYRRKTKNENIVEENGFDKK